jgi:hypothetical protein
VELLRGIAGARRLWARARDPRGTLVEIYLRSRGLTLPPAPVLRWAPSCWNREVQRYLPAMLARVDGPDCKLVAVHRTWLGPDGRKAELHEPKKSLGPICGGAVRLAPAAPVLVIAEGIENALTAIVAKGIPAWSAVSSGGIKGLLLPPVVDEVVIVADHDRNGVGELAARRAGLCDDGGRLVVRCLSGCARRDVHKELCCRHLGGNGRANGNGNGNRVAALETCTEHEAKAVAAAAKRTSRIAAALDIWRNSFPATDTVAETYLASPGTRKPGLQILTRSSPRVLWSATCQRRRRADPPARQRENLSRGQRAAWESRSGDRAAATRAGALRRLQEFAPGSVQP